VGCFSEIISMKFNHVVGLLCAARLSGVTGQAREQQKTVKDRRGSIR